MSALSVLLSSALAAFSRLAPRERALGTVLLLIGCAYFLISVWDWSNSEEDRALSSAADHQRAQQMATIAKDTSQQSAVLAQIERLRQLSYVASTTSIARADAQAALRSAGAAAGILDLAVVLDPASEGSSRLALQTLTIEGTFSWRTFLAFCELVAQSEQSIIVEALSVTSGRVPKFRMSLTTSLASQAG